MIDLYCERVGAGLFAEPLNLSTNLFFLLAALRCAGAARRAKNVDALALAFIVFAIGLGSGLFHMFATPWAELLDVIPILVFQVVYLWLYLRRIAHIRLSQGVAALAVFLAAIVATAQFPPMLNGSLSYLPAAAALVIIGAYHYLSRQTHPAVILAASAIFLVSLSARTVDQTLCSDWPLGTHFVWHMLNALVLFMIVRTYMRNTSAGN